MIHIVSLQEPIVSASSFMSSLSKARETAMQPIELCRDAEKGPCSQSTLWMAPVHCCVHVSHQIISQQKKWCIVIG
ncbi:uncharacterized protein Gasu_44460 [Galdieria sulphuraria]|uniref:Uncharacterized protein n=1 Tax=Galdieria sulphuraria TaxID=130081 RepID=M2XWV7_GALSU|nr:uncharacterized protein Gasu_44460 [Galdieria sulphuraria]EME28113.1 hypothetical protein Gasu_44460 [Galdieria sulphuraria]|eukprot:XP_005704633.1 hypothetical protein Gasu_44460 [Galdieria sulphuraria]